MKRIIISVVILALLAGMSVWSVVAVENKTQSLTDKIHEIEKAYENGDSKKCTKTAKALRDEWEAFIDRSVLINDLSYALDITSSISEIYSYAQANSDDIYAVCDKAEVQIAIFKTMQLPTFWKIL